MSDKLSAVNEVAHPGSPGFYRRISATKDLLFEETNAVRLREQQQLDNNNQVNKQPLSLSQSHSAIKFNLNLFDHEKLKRAWSAPDKGQLLRISKHTRRQSILNYNQYHSSNIYTIGTPFDLNAFQCDCNQHCH